MDFPLPMCDLKPSKEMRGLLSGTLGPVVDLDGALDICKGKTLAAIGDVVTSDFVRSNMVPKICAIDGMTMRGEKVEPLDESLFNHVHHFDNPPGIISKRSWIAVSNAYAREGNTLLKISGEEDLLSLPSIILGPNGGVVAFGVPKRGIGINPINEKNSHICMEIIRQMEAC